MQRVKYEVTVDELINDTYKELYIGDKVGYIYAYA